MTLDVTIGKIIEDETKCCYDKDVIMAPESTKNICNPTHTLWPKEAYRSGSSGLWDFFEHYCNELYFSLREHPHTNDRDVAPLRPHLDKINALPDTCENKTNEDRMVWFKYWANKAVELYGDDAGIKFN